MSAGSDNNPFVGLRPFESHESLLFFGRKDQTLELLQRLHQFRFVAVTGSSGSGKSSLIRAGLIPKLKAGFLVNNTDRWIIAIMRPGQTPLRSLAESILSQPDLGKGGLTDTVLEKRIADKGPDAVLEILEPLRQNGTNFFLLVDQFEELFRFAFHQDDFTKKDEAKDFVNILLALSAQKQFPVYIVITMRSDFIGDCSLIYGLPEALNQSQYIVPRLNRLQLKQTIEGPVKLFRGRINAALVTRLLNDVQLVNDELPLLQHTLMRIWDHEETVSQNGEMDLADYASVGGIEKALSNDADKAYNALEEEQKTIAQKMFQALTTVDENGRKIRRPVHLRELEAITGASREQLTQVISKFIEDKRFFLIVTPLPDYDDSLVDISHESLIRQWGLLWHWVTDEANNGKTLQRLSETRERLAGEAMESGSKETPLLKGLDLQIALRWLRSFNPNSAWGQRYVSNYEETVLFLHDSERAWQASLEKERKEQERKRRNRKLLVAGLIVVILIISGLAYAIYKSDQATKKQLALNYWSNSQSSRKQNDKLTGLHFTAEALLLSNDADLTKSLLVDIRPFLPVASLKASFHFQNFILATAFQPGGGRLALAGNDDSVRIIDPGTGKVAVPVLAHELPVNSVVFSPDGNRLLTASNDATARVWDVSSGNEFFSLPHPDKVADAFYSQNGQQILTIASDKFIRIWNATTGKPVDSLRHTENIATANFSPDSKWILIVDNLGHIWRWDLATKKKEILYNEKIRTAESAAVAFSSNGERFLIAVRGDPVLQVWDANSKQPVLSIDHPSEIRFATFSPGDKYIVTTGRDGYVRFWDPVLGTQVGSELKHEGPAFHVAFNQDGTTIATTGWDKTVRIWQMPSTTANPIVARFKHNGSVNTAAFNQDGSRIVTASSDSTARIWDVNTHRQLALLPHDNEVKNAIFNPEGTQVLTTCEDSVLRVWDWKTGKLQKTTKVTGAVTVATYSGDGKIIAVDGGNSRIRLLNAANLQLLDSFRYQATVKSLALSRDGKTILLGGSDSTVRIVNLKSGNTLASFRHEDAVTSAVFSPDEKKILTASFDTTARLWDLASLQQIGPSMKHGRSITTVAFSPDGKWIATTCYDGTARLWDVSTQKELGIVLQLPAGVNSAVFSPDGKSLLVAGGDGTVSLVALSADLDIPPDLFQLQAKALTGTALNTVTGETQYLPEEEWESLKQEYIKKGQLHAQACQYLTYNIWQRFYAIKKNQPNSLPK